MYRPCAGSIFSILLLAFELRVKRSDAFVKRYFGFMYDYVGRTAFLLLYVRTALPGVVAHIACCLLLFATPGEPV